MFTLDTIRAVAADDQELEGAADLVERKAVSFTERDPSRVVASVTDTNGMVFRVEVSEDLDGRCTCPRWVASGDHRFCEHIAATAIAWLDSSATSAVAAPGSATKRCPFCAEEIQAAAIKCKHCGSEISRTSPEALSKPPISPLERRSLSARTKRILVAAVGIAVAGTTAALLGFRAQDQSKTPSYSEVPLSRFALLLGVQGVDNLRAAIASEPNAEYHIGKVWLYHPSHQWFRRLFCDVDSQRGLVTNGCFFGLKDGVFTPDNLVRLAQFLPSLHPALHRVDLVWTDRMANKFQLEFGGTGGPYTGLVVVHADGLSLCANSSDPVCRDILVAILTAKFPALTPRDDTRANSTDNLEAQIRSLDARYPTTTSRGWTCEAEVNGKKQKASVCTTSLDRAIVHGGILGVCKQFRGDSAAFVACGRAVVCAPDGTSGCTDPR